MADYILMEGDMAMFIPAFGVAIVVVLPGTLKASGKPLLGGKKICLEGDEKQVSVMGCSYITPAYTVPGVGTITIKALAANHKTKTLVVSGKPVVLKGGKFEAEFAVMAPATTPPPSATPDSTTKYSGYGNFVTTNMKWQSS
jgi:hypothetical protein